MMIPMRPILPICLMLTACAPAGLRTGDLVFTANDPNGFVDAIEAVTPAATEDLSFSHVGILEVKGNDIRVIEATPEAGVTVTAWEAFLAGAAVTPFGRPAAAVYRPRISPRQAEEAVRRARAYVGRPYDFVFAPGDSALYCSELVHRAYRASDGAPLFEAQPMTFCDSTGATSPLWLAYFARLGAPVPEGLPGTNPNALARSPRLTRLPR